MNNKNYRVMKFFEAVNKQDKSRGYVRLDIRGIKGNMIVSVENLGDVKSASEVYLYKDKVNKIKIGDINNRKGVLKKILTFGNNNAIEDYNVCAIVKDKKIVMYTNLFNPCSLEQIRKLEATDESAEDVMKLQSVTVPEERFPESANAMCPIEEDLEEEKEVHKADVVGQVEEVEKVEETIAEEIAEEIEEAVAEEVEKSVEEVEKADTGEYVEDDVQEAAEENERIKKTSVNSAVDLKEASEEVEEDNEDVHVQTKFQKPRNKFEESLYNVLKDYKQVEPLSVKIKNLYWWYIPYDETGMKNGFLPYYSQIVSSYYPYPMSSRVTTCSSLMKRYGHYMFGIYKEKGGISKFVYGIPGEFSREEQPYKGATGFKNWSYGSKQGKQGKQGYWLAFVNPRTGETTEAPNIVLSK